MASDQNRQEKASKTRKHYNAVLASSGATYGTLQVLRVLLWSADFYESRTRLSKEQIMEQTGLKITTVKRALKFLREEGSIEAIQGALGGCGIATTYRFCVVGQGAEVPARTTTGKGKSTVWDRIAAQYKARDPNEYKNWMHKLEFASFEAGRLVMVAPTAFHANHCRTQLADKVLAVAFKAGQDVNKIEFLAT